MTPTFRRAKDSSRLSGVPPCDEGSSTEMCSMFMEAVLAFEEVFRLVVVTMVTLMPLETKRFENCIIGVRWPCNG